VDAASNGFDLRQLRHRSIVEEVHPSAGAPIPWPCLLR
jgi:hypothetical protein